eukprot:gene12521-16685_t
MKKAAGASWKIGKWNAIRFLNDKTVDTVFLEPSLPEWKVNLTKNKIAIIDSNQIDSIINLLKRSEMYAPNHPMQVWETKLTFHTIDSTFKIKVTQTQNNGCVITTPTNEWRNDLLGKYLAEKTAFTAAFYSDTARVRN